MRVLAIIIALTQLLCCCSTPRQLIYQSPENLETEIQTGDQLIIKTKAGSEMNFKLISREETTLFGWKTETLGGAGIRTQTQIDISQIEGIAIFRKSNAKSIPGDKPNYIKVSLISGVEKKGRVTTQMFQDALLDSTLELNIETGTISIEIARIQNISWREPSSAPLTGAIVGGLVGLLGAWGMDESQQTLTTIATLGFAEPVGASAEWYVGGILVGASMGALLGTAVGAKKSIKKISINGSFDTYASYFSTK